MLQIKYLNAGILTNLDLSVMAQQCIALCGPSGSGKTTLLNAIAGYINYQGQISIEAQIIDKLPSWQRPCRYLNQRLYLFPHLTLLANLHLAQYAAKQEKSSEQCLLLLEQVGIKHLAHRYPEQISGGEQQRVALARVLISKPKLLLLDEPFSSLDWKLRLNLWQLVASLKKQLKMTILLVTHEPKEAEVLANQIYHLERGYLSTDNIKII